MTKKQIRIFPDYCSSGVWSDVGNMDESEINMDTATRLALKYWHFTWEQWDIDMPSLQPHSPSKQWINGFYKEWWEDGKRIACLIASFNPDLDVVYMADTPEEIMELYYGETK